MDNIIKNYEEVLVKPPTTRLYLKFLKHKWKSKRFYKNKNKQQTKPQEENHNETPYGIEVVSFAILIDNVVVDIMNVQKEFGEILKQDPKFVFIQKDEHRPHIGWVYIDNSFASLQDISFESQPTTRG